MGGGVFIARPSEARADGVADARSRPRPAASSATCRRWCRGARCRAPTRSPTTRRQCLVGGVPAQVGVLVVQRADLPARPARVDGAARAARRVAHRDRHLEVVGDVALAAGRGSPGRARARDCTMAQTSSAGAQRRRRSPSRCSTCLQEALVVAVVVRDVAARAQQAPHRPRQRRLQRAAATRSKIAEPPAVSSTSSSSNRLLRVAGARRLRRGPSAR